MIENKDLPTEFVSIRQVWLKQINRVTEAITHRYMTDVRDPYNVKTGEETMIESVIALYNTLVDFGEATIRSDVAEWVEEHRNDANQKKDSRVYHFRKMFEFIIATLNKYGMLFDSTPQGYSNTIMKSVE